MAEQTFAGPAPAPALVFAERESSEPLKQLFGHNENFVEVSYIPPLLAGAFAGRERNLLALPTLDMYLPLSKYETIVH